ncbi:MAG TPA: hypothetical protein DEA90_12310 [Opitutae bacterium]|nr:hypothetical protein [Opitutae bacterium]
MKISQSILIFCAFVFGCGITAFLMQRSQQAVPDVLEAPALVEDDSKSEMPAPVQSATEQPSLSIDEAQVKLDETLIGIEGNLKRALDLSVDLGRNNYEDRFLAITRLREDLSDAEVTALAQFLYVPYSEQQGLSLLEFNALKNEVMGKLVSLGSDRVDAASVFSSMARFKDLDDLIRDYSIQFSYHLYEESLLEQEDVPYDRTLADMALNERETTLAGTALLGEVRLSEANPGSFPSEKVASTAWSLLNDPQTLEVNRVSAMTSLTRLGDNRVLPKAREALAGSNYSVMTIAALGSIREFGDTLSIPEVRRIAASTNPSVSRAARFTLKHLESL